MYNIHELLTISDETFDMLHRLVNIDLVNLDGNIAEQAQETFRKETGLEWYIHSEDLYYGTVTLKILNRERLFLARLKYGF